MSRLGHGLPELCFYSTLLYCHLSYFKPLNNLFAHPPEWARVSTCHTDIESSERAKSGEQQDANNNWKKDLLAPM